MIVQKNRFHNYDLKSEISGQVAGLIPEGKLFSRRLPFSQVISSQGLNERAHSVETPRGVPGFPNLDPVLKKIAFKMISRSRNRSISNTPFYKFSVIKRVISHDTPTITTL